MILPPGLGSGRVGTQAGSGSSLGGDAPIKFPLPYGCPDVAELNKVAVAKQKCERPRRIYTLL